MEGVSLLFYQFLVNNGILIELVNQRLCDIPTLIEKDVHPVYFFVYCFDTIENGCQNSTLTMKKYKELDDIWDEMYHKYIDETK